MRALIGVSAVLVAGLNCAGRASERSDPGDPPWQAPAERGIQVAQADTAALPVARVAGVSGSAIGLGLTPPADGVRFAKFPDFPAELKLSHGFRLRGYWIVSVNDLPQLSLISPPGFSGAVKLTVQFFRDNETAAIAQRLMMVELKPAEAAARAEPPPGKPAAVATRAEPPPPRPAPVPPTRPSLEQETETLDRAIKLMRSGDIASARLLFEDLAVSGSPKGARALAETYDPAYLKGLFIAGLQPNLETARKWYRRAIELGDAESVKRLAALN